MKNYKKAASLLLGISLTATSALAANLSVKYGSDERLNVSGTDFTNGAVSITVAHSSEGDTYSASTKFAALAEIIPDYKGNISFSTALPADSASGNYVVTAYDKNGGPITATFFYVNKVAAQKAFDILDGDLTDTQLFDTLNEYKAELGIVEDLADETVDIGKTANLMKQFKPKDGFTVDSFNVCWASAKLAGGKTYTAEEFVAEAEEKASLLGLDNLPYASLSQEQKEKVFEKLSSAEISSDNFASLLNETAFLTCINDADITRSSFEKLMFDDYADYLSLDTSAYDALRMPDNVITTMMKNTYGSFTEFCNAFYNAVSGQQNAETPQNPGSGFGGGGGGGGGGVSASGSYDSTPTVPAPTPDVPVQTPTASVFDDMKDHWATAAVEALKAKGIVNGVGDNMFAPDRELTRAEFAKMIAESFFASADAGTATFADVASDSWYASYVSKLASLGVVTGTDDQTFAPELGVTREAAAVIMHRTAKLIGVSLSPIREKAAFTDTISDYAKDAVAELYSAGLINGLSADTFSAYTRLTRAQAAQLVYNMIK